MWWCAVKHMKFSGPACPKGFIWLLSCYNCEINCERKTFLGSQFSYNGPQNILILTVALMQKRKSSQERIKCTLSQIDWFAAVLWPAQTLFWHQTSFCWNLLKQSLTKFKHEGPGVSCCISMNGRSSHRMQTFKKMFKLWREICANLHYSFILFGKSERDAFRNTDYQETPTLFAALCVSVWVCLLDSLVLTVAWTELFIFPWALSLREKTQFTI